ncbi:MAG: hypothetical protein IKV64_00340 [Clostridia bacterium]|nr:hypothetical protein [Clostridia bacterium]
MINIPIDEFSGVIQPYFDGGESYKGHFKYSLVPKYKADPQGSMKQSWDSVAITIAPNGTTTIETDGLNIDVSEYSRFRLFCAMAKEVHVKLYINNALALESDGHGKQARIDSTLPISVDVVNSIKYEFTNSTEYKNTISIFYLGVIDDAPRKKCPYTSEWEGFFVDEPSMEMYNEIMYTKEEIENIRKNKDNSIVKNAYESMKKTALEGMETEPEQYIRRAAGDFFRGPYPIHHMRELALVGQVEQNPEMLKMACRQALSIASCDYWTGDAMEVMPLTTWHHRSFTEEMLSVSVSMVIALAGNFLTWHGRNYLYNAIIMKGLPRLEADFMTMEYIYSCNQGVAFMSGYVPALITLSQQYPRYKMKIEMAQKLIDEMWKKSIYEDGSSDEGPQYWEYTIATYLELMKYLARYENKTLKEYVGDRLNATAEFGLKLIDTKGRMLYIGDVHMPGPYGRGISTSLYEITGDKRWAKMATIASRGFSLTADNETENVEASFEIPFSTVDSKGFAQACRNGIQIFTLSGPSNDTHCHNDKGSFIIYKDGEMVIPDIMLSYTNADSGRMHASASHTLALPVVNGETLEQKKGSGVAADVKKVTLENGVFEWQSDNTNVWDEKIVKSNIRTIVSPNANEYIITDEFEFTQELPVCVQFNYLDKNAFEVHGVNWTPETEEDALLCTHKEKKIYQLQLTSPAAKSHKLITKLTIK